MLRWIISNQFMFIRQLKKVKKINNNQINKNQIVEQDDEKLYTRSHQYQYLKNKINNQNVEKIDDKKQLMKNLMKKYIQQQSNKNQSQSQIYEEEKQTKRKKANLINKINKKLAPNISPEEYKRQQNLYDQQKIKNDRQLQTVKYQIYQQMLKQQKINKKYIQHSPQKALLLARQDLAIAQMMKNTKQKQLKILNKNGNNDLLTNNESTSLLIKHQKIIQALQNKKQITQQNIEVTKQDLIKMKYSPQLIQKAKKYVTSDLAYMKKLIINQDAQKFQTNNIMKRRNIQQNYKRSKIKPVQFIQNKIDIYSNTKQSSQIMIPENQQFLLKKAQKQLKQKYQLTQQQKNIKKNLEQDLSRSQISTNIFMDEVTHVQSRKGVNKMDYLQTSFGKQKNKLYQLNKKLQKLDIDISFDQLKKLSKISLFQQKKLKQQQQGYQKYLFKKQKKKLQKKQLKQIHKNLLKDDLDFQKIQEPVMTLKQLKQSNDVQNLQDHLQKIQQFQKQKNAGFIKKTPQQIKSQIHFKKTFLNMKTFIQTYLVNGLLNHNVTQADKIQFLQILPNKKNTVIYIFWDFQPNYLIQSGIVKGKQNYEILYKAQKQKFSLSLNRQSSYISGKMTQMLKLRYGPQIRFLFDEKTKLAEQAIEEFNVHIKQIALVEVEQKVKKGLIKPEQQQEYYQKYLQSSKHKIHEFNNRKYLMSRKYRQSMINQEQKKQSKKSISKQKINKKPKNNQQQQLQQPTQVKINTNKRKLRPQDKFWNQIDLL